MATEPSQPGLSQFGALFLMICGIVFAVLLHWQNIEPATYANVAEEAPKVVTALTVVAIFMERALAVINAAWLGEEAQRAKAMQRNALAELEMARSDFVEGGAGDLEELRHNLREANAAVGENEAKKQRIRVVVGFLFGLAISAAGVRTMSSLVTHVDRTQLLKLFNLTDIILTAGLLAGGSDGMAKVARLIGSAIDRTTDLLNKSRPEPPARKGV